MSVLEQRSQEIGGRARPWAVRARASPWRPPSTPQRSGCSQSAWVDRSGGRWHHHVKNLGRLQASLLAETAQDRNEWRDSAPICMRKGVAAPRSRGGVGTSTQCRPAPGTTRRRLVVLSARDEVRNIAFRSTGGRDSAHRRPRQRRGRSRSASCLIPKRYSPQMRARLSGWRLLPAMMPPSCPHRLLVLRVPPRPCAPSPAGRWRGAAPLPATPASASV